MRFFISFILLLTIVLHSYGQIKIATTVKPLADIVKEISKDKVEVYYIIPPNINFHIYEYKTSDIKKVSESDLFIYIGSGEPNITGIVKNIPKDKALKVSSLKGLVLLREEDHPDEIHPALWLDPMNAKVIAKFITDYLSKKDPVNRDFYLKNYQKFSQKIDNLISYGNEKLSKLKNKNFVSYHYEFPYFVNRFKLIYLTEIEMGHGREPTPKHIFEVIQKIKLNNVKTIFTSKQFYNKKVIDLIVSKTQVKVVFLDSQGENPTYIDMMRYNIDKVYEGLNY
ncbi:MAG: metal ABC transporter substrate-binding protein [Hydrogenothermaceae bacterium]